MFFKSCKWINSFLKNCCFLLFVCNYIYHQTHSKIIPLLINFFKLLVTPKLTIFWKFFFLPHLLSLNQKFWELIQFQKVASNSKISSFLFLFTSTINTHSNYIGLSITKFLTLVYFLHIVNSKTSSVLNNSLFLYFLFVITSTIACTQKCVDEQSRELVQYFLTWR